MLSSVTVESNYREFEEIGIKEVEINHEASTYIADNYSLILDQARRMGVDPDKVEDLVQDVFVSIVTGENEGNGYDISHSRENSVITVADFVFGRLKGYSKNVKYQSGCEKRRSSNPADNIDIVSASPTDTDLDKLDSMQRAYASAPSFDETEKVELFVSLRQDIELCLDFNDAVGFNLVNLFRNIDLFSNDFNSSIFERLSKALKYHTEFGEAFKNVLLSARADRDTFDSIIAEY